MKIGKTWVRDLKNFLALGTPGGTAGCSPVRMLVKLVAPHFPAEIISCLMDHKNRDEMHVTQWQGLSISLQSSEDYQIIKGIVL